MTALLSFFDLIFLIIYSGLVIRFGLKRALSERSSLICLAAGFSIFAFFRTEAFWQLLRDYPAHYLIYHLLFVASWGVTAALFYGCLKLTEISRIKRKLVQDLALLNYEPVSNASSVSELILSNAEAKS